MAFRGAKPKPSHLHLVDGTRNVTRHGTEAELRENADGSSSAFGPIVKPKSLKSEAARAWQRYIAPAWWLDASKEASAIAFCELWSEFRQSPANFQAARHGQMRAYMSELGLTDERNRSALNGDQKSDEFFDD